MLFLLNLNSFFEDTLTTCLFVFKKVLIAKIIFLLSLNGEVGWNKNRPSIFSILFSYQFKACKAADSEVLDFVHSFFGLNQGARNLYCCEIFFILNESVDIKTLVNNFLIFFLLTCQKSTE